MQWNQRKNPRDKATKSEDSSQTCHKIKAKFIKFWLRVQRLLAKLQTRAKLFSSLICTETTFKLIFINSRSQTISQALITALADLSSDSGCQFLRSRADFVLFVAFLIDSNYVIILSCHYSVIYGNERSPPGQDESSSSTLTQLVKLMHNLLAQDES